MAPVLGPQRHEEPLRLAGLPHRGMVCRMWTISVAVGLALGSPSCAHTLGLSLSSALGLRLSLRWA